MNDEAIMLLRRLFVLWAGIVAVCALGGCSSPGPYNLSSNGDDSRLMLNGHDPVAYFTMGKHIEGRAIIKAEHDGVTYRFISDEHRQLFIKSPDKFQPQYGGFCANGIAYGIPWGGDADTWKIIEGRLYIFGGAASMKYFLMDEKRNLELAENYWQSEVKGASALTQRWKRLILRVPHYKSGKELETEWVARQKGEPAPESKRAL